MPVDSSKVRYELMNFGVPTQQETDEGGGGAGQAPDLSPDRSSKLDHSGSQVVEKLRKSLLPLLHPGRRLKKVLA